MNNPVVAVVFFVGCVACSAKVTIDWFKNDKIIKRNIQSLENEIATVKSALTR